MNYPKKLFYIDRNTEEAFPMRLVDARPQAWMMSFRRPGVEVEDKRTFTNECYINEAHLFCGTWVRAYGKDIRPQKLILSVNGVRVEAENRARTRTVSRLDKSASAGVSARALLTYGDFQEAFLVAHGILLQDLNDNIWRDLIRNAGAHLWMKLKKRKG